MINEKEWKKERKERKKEKKIKERMNEWKNIRLIYLDTHIFIYMCIHIYRVSKPTNFLTITLITPRMLYLFYRLYIFTSYVSLHPSSPLQLLYTSKSTSYKYIYRHRKYLTITLIITLIINLHDRLFIFTNLCWVTYVIPPTTFSYFHIYLNIYVYNTTANI